MGYCRSIWGSFCIIWNWEEKNINPTVIISLLRTACRLSLRLLGIFNSLCNADLTPPSPQCIYWESILRKLQTTPPSPPPYWLAPETWETKGHILCQCSWFARVHFDCVPLWRGGACLPRDTCGNGCDYFQIHSGFRRLLHHYGFGCLRCKQKHCGLLDKVRGNTNEFKNPILVKENAEWKKLPLFVHCTPYTYVKVAEDLKHLCFFSVKINISTTGGFRVGFFQPDTNHP